MIIKSIKLVGFIPLEKKSNRESGVHMKFPTGKDYNKKICLFGRNASGKTSIMNELQIFEVNQHAFDLMNNKSRKELEFEYDDETYKSIIHVTAKVYRLYKLDKGTNEFVIIPETEKGNKSLYLEYIKVNLGLSHIIDKLFYITGKESGFIGMNNTERKKFITRISSLLRAIQAVHIGEIQPKLSNLNYDFKRLTQKLTEAGNENVLREEVSTFEKKLQDVEDVYTKENNSIIMLRNSISNTKQEIVNILDSNSIGLTYNQISNSDVSGLFDNKITSLQSKLNNIDDRLKRTSDKYSDNYQHQDKFKLRDIIRELYLRINKLIEEEKYLNNLQNDDQNSRKLSEDKEKLYKKSAEVNNFKQEVDNLIQMYNINSFDFDLLNITDKDISNMTDFVSHPTFYNINIELLTNETDSDVILGKLNELNDIKSQYNNNKIQLERDKEIIAEYESIKESNKDHDCDYASYLLSIKKRYEEFSNIDIKNIDKEIGRLNDRLKKIEYSATIKDSLRIFVDSIRNTVLYTYTSKIPEVKDVMKYFDSSDTFLNIFFNGDKDDLSGFNKLHQFIMRIRHVFKNIGNKRDVLTKISFIQNEMEKLNIQINDLDASILRTTEAMFKKPGGVVDKSNSLVELNNSISETNEKIKVLEDLVLIIDEKDMISRSMNDLSKSKDKLVNLFERIHKDEGVLNTKIEELHNYTNDKKNYQDLLMNKKIALNVIEETKKEFKTVEQDKGVLKLINDLYNNRGLIVSDIINNIGEELSKITKELVNIVFKNDNIEVIYEIDEKKFNISIFKNGSHQGDVSSGVSDGERDFLKIIILFAIHTYINNTNSGKGFYSILRLDEIDSCLDQIENKQIFSNELLSFLSNNHHFSYSQIFIISHNPHIISNQDTNFIILNGYTKEDLNIVDDSRIIFDINTS